MINKPKIKVYYPYKVSKEHLIVGKQKIKWNDVVIYCPYIPLGITYSDADGSD